MKPEASAISEARDEPTVRERAEESVASVLKPSAVCEMPEGVEPSTHKSGKRNSDEPSVHKGAVMGRAPKFTYR